MAPWSLIIPAAGAALGALSGSRGSSQGSNQRTDQTTTRTPPSALGGFNRLEQGLGYLDSVYNPSGGGPGAYVPFQNNPFYQPDVFSGILGRSSGGPRDYSFGDMSYRPGTTEADPGSSTQDMGMQMLVEWLREQLGGNVYQTGMGVTPGIGPRYS